MEGLGKLIPQAPVSPHWPGLGPGGSYLADYCYLHPPVQCVLEAVGAGPVDRVGGKKDQCCDCSSSRTVSMATATTRVQRGGQSYTLYADHNNAESVVSKPDECGVNAAGKPA